MLLSIVLSYLWYEVAVHADRDQVRRERLTDVHHRYTHRSTGKGFETRY